MRSPATSLLLSFFLFAVTGALALAGWHHPGQQAAATKVSRAAPLRPQFVRPVRGWLVGGGADARPAFRVDPGADVSAVYDLYPAKDAIPALQEPLLTPAAEAEWLPDQAPVLGLKVGAEAHCYPLAILNWHCLVRDRLGGQALYVFWDPPSGLAVARRTLSAQRLLGLAGYGCQGVGLTYDQAFGRLYNMLSGQWVNVPPAARGFGAGDSDWLPLERMTWRQWRRLHPATLVLSRDTGYSLDYGFDPYTAAALGPKGAAEDYWTSETVLAPDSLRDRSQRLPDKSQVLGLLIGGQPWAVPLEGFSPGQAQIDVSTPAGHVQVHAQPAEDRYYATDAAGAWLPQVRLFWFAWKANFPQTQVYQQQEAISSD